MAADCSFFRPSTAFTTVCVQYCSAAGSKLLIIPLVSGFHNGCVLSCSTDGTLLFVIPLVDSFHDACTPYCSADGTMLLILPLVNGFPDVSQAVFLCGWQHIAHSAACQRVSWFGHCIAHQRAVDYSFFTSYTAFTTVYMPYCSFFHRL